ncbi:hypothetical protein DAI22_08g109400 [Oryza sativa Japonica Group]|nr:hypothetical protein DAI22_08g109400 [Oryza sativa Japonica Group]
MLHAKSSGLNASIRALLFLHRTISQPRIPRAKTSLLHPQPRRPRASLPRSLLPASSQERLPTAAAAILLARSSFSPLLPLRRALAGAAAAVLLLPHRRAPLFPTSFFPDRASPTRISRRRSRLWPLLRRRNQHRPQPAAVLLLPHRRGCPPHGLLLCPAAGATPRPRRSRRRIVLLPLGPVRISVLHLRRSPLSLSLRPRLHPLPSRCPHGLAIANPSMPSRAHGGGAGAAFGGELQPIPHQQRPRVRIKPPLSSQIRRTS